MADIVLLWSLYPASTHSIENQGVLSAWAYGTSQNDVTPTPTFKMRALASPGPGYVSWVTRNNPDYAGSKAPSAIQGGTAVLTSSWGKGKVQYLRVPTIDTIQNVSDNALVTNPGLGVTLVLVDTAAGSWSDSELVTLFGSPQTGAEVIIKDDGGQADVKRILVASSDGIDGVPSKLIDTIRGKMHILFDGSTWRVI